MKAYNLKNQGFENGQRTETSKFIDSLEPSKQGLLHLIETAIRENRSVDDRITEIKNCGIMIRNVAMGSGGVGQIKVLNNGIIRVQISHGIGRWNYAYVAVIF